MENVETKVLTQEELYKQQTHCPSCGRFVGTYTRCPYCQALTQKRLSIQIFKTVAVLTSTVGLILLLFFARNVKTPEVKIASLGPLSNFAHVRVVGIVDKSYGIHPKWKSLGFVIAQGKGAQRKLIRISAYSKIAKNIESKGLVPNVGDLVSVEGQVRFQKQSPSLLINAHEHLSIIKRNTNTSKYSNKPQTFQLKEVAANEMVPALLGKYVKVTGSVISTKSFESGSIINLDDGKSGLPVWLPKFCLPANFNLVPGDLISAIGKVETYKEKLEVKVNKENSLTIISRVNPQSDEKSQTEEKTESETEATPQNEGGK